MLEKGRNESKFYKDAHFYSVPEMIEMIEKNKFTITDIFQTLTEPDNDGIESPVEGFGEGGFVVIKGRKTDLEF